MGFSGTRCVTGERAMRLRYLPRATAAAIAASAVLVACRHPEPPPPPPPPAHAAGSPRLLSVADLAPAERQYGHSASRSAAVTYQPDVVIPPAGASAVRALSADGLIWTIDPVAIGADEIVQGKVLLLTSRAAGRVLAVEKAADGLRVVLGPVEITDIIRDGQFSMDQPLDVTQGLQFATPTGFDPPMPVAPLVGRAGMPDGPGMRYARFTAADGPV